MPTKPETLSALRAKRRANGRCIRCNQPTTTVHCARCQAKRRKSNKLSLIARRKAGICLRCPAAARIANFCRACYRRKRETMRARYTARKAAGVCVLCGVKAKGSTVCASCGKKRTDNKIRRR